MSAYQPLSRRPIADLFRRTAHGAVRWCVRRNVHPDVVSYASLVASALAALCFWRSGTHPLLLLIAPVFCYLRLWFNMLDGMVALASNKASLHGEIINELPDRISDILIFAAVAHSGWNAPPFGYWAALMAVLTAYVGCQGQAVGVQREYSGLMSKPWRMVVLHAGAWFTLFTGNARISGIPFSIMEMTLVVIIAGCLQTMTIRLMRITRSLRAKEHSD